VTFTAVVPIRDSARTIGACLSTLREAGGSAVEIIVVDDGSVDDSVRHAEPYANLILHTEASAGPARARNLGAQNASAEIILFVDADVMVPRDTFVLLEQRFKADGHLAGVQGVYSIGCPFANPASQYKNFYYHYSWMKRVKNLSLTSAASFCLAVRSKTFMGVGGFDERIANPTVEDADLGHRIVTEGGLIVLERKLQVVHDRAYHLRELLWYDRRMATAKTRLLLRGRGRPGRAHSNVAVSTARASEMKAWLGTLASPPVVLVFGLVGWPVPALFAFCAGIAFQIPFLSFVAKRKGYPLACALCGITLLDAIIVDVGIVWGCVSFLFGKRY
jgi:glycosyltransferase involved in cell wall biosynthesis